MGMTWDPALRSPAGRGKRAFPAGDLSALEKEPEPRHVEELLTGGASHPSSVSVPGLTTAGASGSFSSALTEGECHRSGLSAPRGDSRLGSPSVSAPVVPVAPPPSGRLAAFLVPGRTGVLPLLASSHAVEEKP